MWTYCDLRFFFTLVLRRRSAASCKRTYAGSYARAAEQVTQKFLQWFCQPWQIMQLLVPDLLPIANHSTGSIPCTTLPNTDSADRLLLGSVEGQEIWRCSGWNLKPLDTGSAMAAWMQGFQQQQTTAELIFFFHIVNVSYMQTSQHLAARCCLLQYI